MLVFKRFYIFLALALTTCAGCKDKNAGAIIPASEFQETVEKANRGDAVAAVRLTYHYDYGLYDSVRADYWRRKAANLGDSQEQFNLYEEEIASQDAAKRREAIQYLKSAANGGKGLARRVLSDRYLSGDGVDQNTEEAYRWLRLAADVDDIESMLRLSDAALQRQGVPKGLAEGYAWAHMASVASHNGAYYAPKALDKIRKISALAMENGVTEQRLIAAAQTIESEIRGRASR